MESHSISSSAISASEDKSNKRNMAAAYLAELVDRAQQGWLTIAITFVCVAIYQSTQATDCLQLISDTPNLCLAIVRSLTCHLTHWSLDQLFWDGIAFLVLGSLCEQSGRKSYSILLLFSALAVSAGVLVGHPELTTYRGLSGIDSALFAYLACRFAWEGFRDKDRWRSIGGIVAWLAFTAKIVYEIITQETMFVGSEGVFQPLPMTHAVGALAGTLVFWGRPNDG